jgi:hypothetical protein
VGLGPFQGSVAGGRRGASVVGVELSVQ